MIAVDTGFVGFDSGLKRWVGMEAVRLSTSLSGGGVILNMTLCRPTGARRP